MNWDVSGLILEGICGTGKTSLMHALTSSAAFIEKSYPSSIVLSEHHTQRILERKQALAGLTPADNLEVLEFFVQFFEKLHERSSLMGWSARNRTNHRIPYLLERFHFTHVFHYGLAWEQVKSIDERLAKINCKVCVLEVDETDLKRRVIRDRENPAWQTYLQGFGSSSAEMIDHFKKQQDLLLNLLEKTQLEWVKINTSQRSIAEVVNQLIPFWNI